MTGTTRRRPEDQRPSLAWLFITMLSIVLLFVAVTVAVATSSRPAHGPQEAPHQDAPHESTAPGESHEPEESHAVETPHGFTVTFPG